MDSRWFVERMSLFTLRATNFALMDRSLLVAIATLDTNSVAVCARCSSLIYRLIIYCINLDDISFK